MRALRVALPAVVVFLGVLIARLPARWAVAAAHRDLHCTRVSGSLWNGVCEDAEVDGASLGDLSWQLHPMDLLWARLAAHVDCTSTNASVHADITLGLGGTLVARHLAANLPLDPRLLPALPPNLSGRAQANLARIEITRKGVIEAIEGRITLNNLIDSTGSVTPLGSYEVVFPASTGAPVGKLHDLGGPLSLEGTLRLTAQPGYDLEVRVATRSSAVPSLVNALQYLGPPDSDGRRPFALSGTY